MKFTLSLLITPLLLLTQLNAEPLTGTTIGHYSKPGAAVDMRYRTNRVEVNQTATLNITLLPTAHSGQMHLEFTLDDNLTLINNSPLNFKFDITPTKREYPIELQLSSQTNGLYYVRILSHITKGGHPARTRAFAIPIRVGEKPKKPVIIAKPNHGENLSISKAIETIRIDNGH